MLARKPCTKAAELSMIMETAIDKKRARETGQMGLFDAPSKLMVVLNLTSINFAPWNDKEN